MGLDIYFKRVKRKEKDLAYYRKCNFLMEFMLDYYGYRDFDEMNCRDIVLDDTCLRELRDRCNKVLKDPSKAEDELPTSEGFCFGNTDYNEYYFKEVENVRDACIEMLKEYMNLDSDEEIIFHAWY